MSGMDSPDKNGLVHATGSIRGGHEYECVGWSLENQLWEFCNSWSDSWGVKGHFFYSTNDLTKLLAAQGDATQLQPLTAPAPTPTPTPPTPSVEWPPLDAYNTFKAHPYSVTKRQSFIKTADAWLATQTS
jgi:hypothetical protein